MTYTRPKEDWHSSKKGIKEYRTWVSIKNRCYNPNNSSYGRYGGRGVTVCARWINSYDNFLEDMGKAPSDKHSIERKDPSKGYEPSNCIWIPHIEQSINRRLTNRSKSGYRGVYLHSSGKWQAVFKRDTRVIYVGTYIDKHDAAEAYNNKATEIAGNTAILNEIRR